MEERELETRLCSERLREAAGQRNGARGTCALPPEPPPIGRGSLRAPRPDRARLSGGGQASLAVSCPPPVPPSPALSLRPPRTAPPRRAAHGPHRAPPPLPGPRCRRHTTPAAAADRCLAPMEDYHKPDQQTLQALKDTANRLRISSIKATTAAGSG